MGSPGGGVGGSSSSGNSGGSGGSSGSDNDRGGNSGGPSGSDRDSSNDRDRASRSDSDRPSDQRGMTGSERTEAAFNDAMSNAASGPDTNDDDKDATDTGIGGLTDSAGETFGGLSSPAGLDNDTTADDAAQAAARDNHHANEFDGLGPSGGPVDNSLPGDDSRNSHRGYGRDGSLAGGIDDDVNAGLAAADANHPANEFSGLGPSGGPAHRDKTENADVPEHQFSGTVNDIAALSNGTLDAGVALSKHVSLDNTADIARAMEKASRFAGPGGRYAGSVAETVEAAMNAEPGERTEAAALGAVKSLDDLAASALGGFIGGVGGGAISGALTGGTATPLGIGLGAAAGSTSTSIAYDGSFIDNAFDAAVDFAFGGSGNESETEQP